MSRYIDEFRMISDDHDDRRDSIRASCHRDARSSFHNPRDDDGALRDHAFHGGRDDLHRDVPYHGDPSFRDDPHDGPSDDVRPSCDGLPCHGDARDDHRASHDDRLCDNHHKTCVPCDTRLYETCDDNRESFRPSYDLFRGRILILYDHACAHDGCRAHHARHDDLSYDRRVRDDGPRDVLCHDGRVRLLRDDDDPCAPYGPLHRVRHDDENDARDHHRVHDDVHDDGYRPPPDLPAYFGNLAPTTRQ